MDAVSGGCYGGLHLGSCAMEWSKRARVRRNGELETRTFQSMCGRWRIQECIIHLGGSRRRQPAVPVQVVDQETGDVRTVRRRRPKTYYETYWLLSRAMGQGWIPVDRFSTRKAAEKAADAARAS